MAQVKDRQNVRSTVLLVDKNPDLRELEQLVLERKGYHVVLLDDVTTVAKVATDTCPDVIVLAMPWNDPQTIHVVDQLESDGVTQAIPLVVISTSEPMAATAQASPNVRRSVIAPYDIDALESGVETALHHPPPPAVLPKHDHQPSAAVCFAAAELARQTRTIVLDTIRAMRQIEPYRSRFPELSLGLVDDLATIASAIANGLERGLTPEEVFSTPDIHRCIDNHVRLRKRQGLGPVEAIHEDQILERQIDQFIDGLIGQAGFTAGDALGVVQGVRDYSAELIRLIVRGDTT